MHSTWELMNNITLSTHKNITFITFQSNCCYMKLLKESSKMFENENIKAIYNSQVKRILHHKRLLGVLTSVTEVWKGIYFLSLLFQMA